MPVRTMTTRSPREGIVSSAVANDRRYTNLEILRIVAALLVIFFHLQQRFALELGLMTWLNDGLRTLGSIGVDLFFVVSGFVIALNVDRGDSAARFSVARIRRILPSYWLLTALAAVTMIAIPSQFVEHFNLARFVSSLFFVNEQFGFREPLNTLAWTLNLEMRFYLIVALALLLIRKVLPRYAVLIVALASLVLFVLIGHQDTIMYEFGFGFGAFAVTKFIRPHLVVGLGLFTLGIAGVAAWLVGITDNQERWICFGLPSFLIVLGALLIPQAKNPALKRLGFASYSTYLTQWFTIPLAVFVVAALRAGETLAPLVFAMSLAACVLAGILYSVVIDERLYALSKKTRMQNPNRDTK